LKSHVDSLGGLIWSRAHSRARICCNARCRQRYYSPVFRSPPGWLAD
jgi:hypothetical protein